MFDESFIDGLPNNPALAGKRICDTFQEFHQSLKKEQEADNYEEYLKALAVLQAYSEAHGIDIDPPPLSGNIKQNIARISEFFSETRGLFDQKFTIGTFDQYKTIFERKFGKGFFSLLSKNGF